MLFDTVPPPVRDSLYVAVGLPLVAAEELQRAARRVAADLEERIAPLRPRAEALSHRLEDLAAVAGIDDLANRLAVTPPSLDELNGRLDAQVRAVEERVAVLEQRLADALDRFEEQLPDPARDVVSRTRGAARDAGTQLRALVSGTTRAA
jgi:hypothetical protein